MKIGVLGSGLMGKEAARDLTLSEQVTEVGLADIDIVRAEQICNMLHSPKIKAFKVDATNVAELKTFMRRYDVIVNALFYSFNKVVAETAIELGVHAVDLGGHIGNITDELLTLDQFAKEKQVKIGRASC